MIIHGPTNADYDMDLGAIVLSDWYHQDYMTLVEQVMAPISEKKPPPFSNNNLINGKMNFPCVNTTQICTPNAGVSRFSFESGKKYRLRLINAGAEGVQKFSIDGHKMTVIANDFVEVQPYETDLVTLAIGQRSDVIVEATGSSKDAVWMRSNLGSCSLTDGVSPEAVAAIYYQSADNTTLPTTNSTISQSDLDYCGNDALSKTQPFYPITPDPNPQTTQNFVISFQANNTGAPDSENFNLWHINNSTFRVDYNDPLLLEAKLGKTSFDSERNVYDFGSNKTVRLVLINTAVGVTHPMHLHGHNMYVLAEGYGTWDGVVTNPSNPQRRDVQQLHAAQDANTPAYAVVQIDMDNPGTWPFHCHIAWHVSAGLYFQLLERPDDLVNDVQIPGIMAQTCRDWTSWTGGHVPDQIDSGL